jgi:hypothetical protein
VLGNPQDRQSLKEYTPAERNKIAQELNEAARRHDKEVVEQLKQAEERLRISGGGIPDQDSSEPQGGVIRQAPEFPAGGGTNRVAGGGS